MVSIDTSKEVIPAEYSRIMSKKLNKKISTSLVAKWMKRGKVRFRRIKELRLTLIELGSESI